MRGVSACAEVGHVPGLQVLFVYGLRVTVRPLLILDFRLGTGRLKHFVDAHYLVDAPGMYPQGPSFDPPLGTTHVNWLE